MLSIIEKSGNDERVFGISNPLYASSTCSNSGTFCNSSFLIFFACLE